MILPVEFLQFISIDVGIYLRRGYIRMTEELLNRPQIGTAQKEVCRKRVTQGMNLGLGKTRLGCKGFQCTPDTLPAQRLAAPVDKNDIRPATHTEKEGP